MTEPRAPADLGLGLPLDGVQWLEASAGTGKTFALATIHSRLVIEAGYAVPELLAVTFTEAATQELRERLRERLVLARDLAADRPPADNEATRITARLIAAAIAREGRPALLRRLQQAVEAMDLAPIHTIHAFCRRALADHALEAGQPLIERALVENETALREEVATDFWRRCATDAPRMAALRALWASPAALAKTLRELLAVDALLPESPGFEPDEALDDDLRIARRALARAFRAYGATAREQLRSALAASAVNKTLVKDEAVDPVWRALSAWQDDDGDGDPAGEKLEQYGAANLAAKTNKNKTTPTSPLFDAIDDWRRARRAIEERNRRRQIALVHEACAYACERLDALKRERGLIGYDDMVRGVAEALDGAHGHAFAMKLRAQYRVALVDEFQDTDPRQWSIFRKIFIPQFAAGAALAATASDLLAPTGLAPSALFLIGDPKQAIYRFRGGDVFTYLDAREAADARHALARNHRSRPSALAAVAALFGGSGPNPFAQAGIDFLPVAPGVGVADADFELDGAVAPALQIDRLGRLADAGIEAARAAATTACVARIHALLAAALAGRARRRVGADGWRAIAPGDIAVLVERNDDAERIRDALARAGIPCVAAGRRSLYDSDEAGELRCLLHALLAPADESRLRAALATPLLGLDAITIAALDRDESARRAWQDRAQGWREQLERYGPLALVNTLCAEQAPRLLGWIDGERRLSNWLQLGEDLQDAPAVRLGPAALLDELERRIADADEASDDELLRLESDAARVKILTLHKSKGLEFDLVFLPYAALRAGAPPSDSLQLARYHHGAQRVAELFTDKHSPGRKQESEEQFAEKLRLLYVGLTRARLATWLSWGAVKEVERTPLAWLLHRGPDARAPNELDEAAIDAGLARLRQWSDDEGAAQAIAIAAAATQMPTQRLSFAPAEPTPPAAVARRGFDRDWWVYSFSQLAREDDGGESRGAQDEAEPATVPDTRFAGARFGNALHAALESADFAAWHEWSGELPPAGQYDLVARALRGQGYAGDNDQSEGIPLLTSLIARTLNARLPEGARLAALPTPSRCPELEFHLAFRPVEIPALVELLHAHGIVRDRLGFGLRRRIEGLLTGFIDLVYAHEGRYYLLDYKSNQLRDYGRDALAEAVREHEYDLQYTIYSLALHRWLRFRIGADYDYDRHFGGIRYLFCRGLDVEAAHSPGIHALGLPRDLIESLDTLLAPANARNGGAP